MPRRLLDLLRSAALARVVLVYLAGFGAVGAWLPWVRSADRPAPRWAQAVGLDHPFSSLFFLAGVALLALATLACTWGKRARLARLLRGELPASLPLLPATGRDVGAFLSARGFCERGGLLVRNPWAAWGGYVLHVGLLLLLAAVALQQALHDGGFFQLAPGERKNLAEPGAVFGRAAGPLAPVSPPDLAVALEELDPFRRQAGYAPDRHSVLSLQAPSEAARVEQLDRARGVRAGGVDVFQAIPIGLAAVVEDDGGRRALHLVSEGPRSAAVAVPEPSGGFTRLVVTSGRDLDDPAGTGPLDARLVRDGVSAPLQPGQSFLLAGVPTRLLSWTRWARYSYSRSPGVAAVFLGFALVLSGAAALAVPCGVARRQADGTALLWMPHGAEALSREWERGES